MAVTTVITGRRCSACKTRVFFSQNSGTGKWAILDAEANPTKGNIQRHTTPTGPMHRVLSAAEAERRRAEGEPLFIDHHATCPYADEFAKGGTK